MADSLRNFADFLIGSKFTIGSIFRRKASLRTCLSLIKVFFCLPYIIKKKGY